MKALVMAGGRATRMGVGVEKPLVELKGKMLIDLTLEKLSGLDEIDHIFIATSPNAPRTRDYVSSKVPNIDVIHTSGSSFHEDLVEAIHRGSLYFPLLILSTDMPLVDAGFLSKVINTYERMDHASLSVFLRVERDGPLASVSFDLEGAFVTPAGINIIDGKCIDMKEIPQFNLIEDYSSKFININTKKDLELARRILDDQLNP
ncbi:MAG TPA: NTP transferase domain-containing protein [Candidatus Methanofastidiosa archaeon]|nr:NTP transferase domain-containing protein [Candidatus Methanofastidiosa archaeon]HPR42059.1 NTP transferase domain-containing protein [Candidatus Methanofastidiosa archaeon]